MYYINMLRRLLSSFALSIIILTIFALPAFAGTYGQGTYGNCKYGQGCSTGGTSANNASSQRDTIAPVATLNSISIKPYSLQEAFVTNTNWPVFEGISSEKGSVEITISKSLSIFNYLTAIANTQSSKNFPWTVEMPYGLLDGAYNVTVAARDENGNTQEFPIKFRLTVITGVTEKLNLKISNEPVTPSSTNLASKNKDNKVNFQVKILDKNGNPVAGVKVILFSTPKEAITDKNGVVAFNGVDASKHRLSIIYRDYLGEQEIDLSDSKGEAVNIAVTIKPQAWYFPPQVKITLAVLVSVIIILLFFLFKKASKK